MKTIVTYLFGLFIIVFASCENGLVQTPAETDDIELNEVNKVNISGTVQKGPFINGTSITLFEISEDFAQTGNTFTTQIIDNEGNFELLNIPLAGPYVEIVANGFYFNEVTGEKSESQITLHCITSIKDTLNVNLNVLSELEKPRINYLVQNGSSFEEAKRMALKEILVIFGITKEDILASEKLDISKSGEDNAILLALSAIIQGYRTDAELTELLANLNTDIKEDGVLDDEQLQSDLISHAKHLNLPSIRTNIEDRYEELGSDYSISDFENYINSFIENSNYEYESIVEFPDKNEEGLLNLLNYTDNVYISGASITDDLLNCITAINPANLNIKIDYEFISECEQTDSTPSCSDGVVYAPYQSGWVSFPDPYIVGHATGSFESDDSKFHDMKVGLAGKGNGKLVVYANGIKIRTKEFTW